MAPRLLIERAMPPVSGKPAGSVAPIRTGGGPGARGRSIPAACTAILLCFFAGTVKGLIDRRNRPSPPAAGKADVDDVLGRLDARARAKALDGAWVLEDADAHGFSSDYTQPLAISIDGAHVQTWNGRALTSGRVQRNGPCWVSLMHPMKDGVGEEGPSYTFVVHDGAGELVVGDAGERVGDGAIVCADHGVYVLDDDGDCTRIEMNDFTGDRPRGRGVRVACGFRRDGDHDVFYYDEDPRFSTAKRETLFVDGWRIGAPRTPDPDDPNRKALHRYDDFAAARAVVDADARANDPVLIAQAAGGRIGDKHGVLGVIATFGDDELAFRDDELVRVTGVVVEQNAWYASEHGRSETGWLRLAAPDHRDGPTIRCIQDPTRGAGAVDDGAVVTVEGHVRGGPADWTRRPFSAAELDDCVVVDR